MDEDLKKVDEKAKEINAKIEGLKASIDEKADIETLESRFAEVTKKLDTLAPNDNVVKMQEQLDNISTQLKQLGEYQATRGKSVNEQLLEKFKSEDFKERVKNFSGKGEIAGFEVKAANIDTDDIETQTEVGVSSAPWRPTPIWDNIAKGVIGQGRDSISWWEETTRTDSAAMVTEQAAPAAGSAKTWTKQSMDIKMIKDYTKISRSALEDFEYITSEVNDLMANGIPREREAELLSGAGSGTHLKGIDEYYKTFAKPANFDAVANPNDGDVLAAAILQVMNGNTSDAEKKGYLPNLILLNPGSKINMQLVKSSIETYVKHPMFSLDGNFFGGIQIVTSLDLAAGQFIVGDFSRAKAYVKRNMRISFHYENEDDVLNDLVLVLASMRIAGLKVTAADAYAFVGGTFAAGKPLITP
jgi:HK97 family phage major capsid protein